MISEYTKYNHRLYEYKSKQYLTWAKQKYPNLDLHHILSKKIDYLVFPIEHKFHLNIVHKHKSYYFDKWLAESVELFLSYVKEKFPEYKVAPFPYQPKELKEIFTKVQKLESKK